MKLLFENWRKLREGDLVQLYPQEPEVEDEPSGTSEEDIQFVSALVNKVEEIVANRLAALHSERGGHYDIPPEKTGFLDRLLEDFDADLRALLTK
jgi:hypothetical protein